MNPEDRKNWSRARASARQTWHSSSYAQNARFVSDLATPVVEMLGPLRGLRVLDLGCGDGWLTKQLEEQGADVYGLDPSQSQINAARKRGVNAYVGDARKLQFHAKFDAVFSNAALHWISPPEPVIEGVARALKTNGRFVGEFGGEGNVAVIHEALIKVLDRRGYDGIDADPWFFPSVQQYQELLERYGFKMELIDLISRPTTLPGDITDWIDTLAGSFLAVAPVEEHYEIKDEVRKAVRYALQRDDGSWVLDYVRLRFAAKLF